MPLAHPRPHAGRPGESGIIIAVSSPKSRRFPVTVTHLPTIRCQICRQTLACRPGQASEVLTEHYRRDHPESLDSTAARQS